MPEPINLAVYDEFKQVMGPVVDAMERMSDEGFPEEKILRDEIADLERQLAHQRRPTRA